MGESSLMAEHVLVFAGCLNREAPYHQGARGRGIAVLALDEASGRLDLLSEHDDMDNPTFLSVAPDRRTLFASSEVFGRREGVVAAFRIGPEGELAYLNMQASQGSICAHNAVSADGRFLLLANYGMGEGGPDRSVVAFPIRDDGTLGPAVAALAHRGGVGPDAARQERPHAHCVRPLGDDGTLLVTDLGLDRIMACRLGADGALEARGETALPPGSGPRHLAATRDGSAVFVVNELSSTVQSFRRGADGALHPVSSCPAVPDGTQGNHCADLHLSPDDRFLYASNRGHDSIAVFAVGEGAAIEPRGHVATGGATPRSFAITPSGRHLVVGNQNSDEIAVLARNAGDGSLIDTGRRARVGTPMCIRVETMP